MLYFFLSFLGCSDAPQDKTTVNTPNVKKTSIEKSPTKKNGWSYVQKNLDSINAILIGDEIKMYSSAKENYRDDDSTLQVEYGKVIQTYTSLLPIQKVIRTISEPYHGPMVALEAHTLDKTKGWFLADQYYVKSKVVNVKSDDVLNVRQEATYKSTKIAEMPPNGSLFYSVPSSQIFEQSGCDKDFVLIYTLEGKQGYVSCRYLEGLSEM